MEAGQNFMKYKIIINDIKQRWCSETVFTQVSFKFKTVQLHRQQYPIAVTLKDLSIEFGFILNLKIFFTLWLLYYKKERGKNLYGNFI